jgi:hypothetical protein
MKKVTDLGEHEAIHCPTEKEANLICALMDSEELCWFDGKAYFNNTEWSVFKENTCYLPNPGSFAELSSLRSNFYRIHPASDFLPNEFYQPTHTEPISPHYDTDVYEPLKIIDHYNLDFREGNVLKYLLRWRKKNGVEDLRKAADYLNKLIEKHS